MQPTMSLYPNIGQPLVPSELLAHLTKHDHTCVQIQPVLRAQEAAFSLTGPLNTSKNKKKKSLPGFLEELELIFSEPGTSRGLKNQCLKKTV